MLINSPDYQHLPSAKSVDFIDLYTDKSLIMTGYLLK